MQTKTDSSIARKTIRQAPMRTLYHLPLSPFSRKVRLVLSEKRLPFDLRAEKVWERRAEYLELNPAGTVPTLVEDNGLVIPDFGRDLRISRGSLSGHAAARPHAGRAGRGTALGCLVRWQVRRRSNTQSAGREGAEANGGARQPGCRQRFAPAISGCAITWSISVGWRRHESGLPAAS